MICYDNVNLLLIALGADVIMTLRLKRLFKIARYAMCSDR